MTAKRTQTFSFRLTPAERKKIDELARKAGLSVTEYLLRAALNKPIVVVPGLDELSRQLKAIGNNLNQLTHRANANQTVVVSLHTTAEALNGIWDELARLTAEVE